MSISMPWNRNPFATEIKASRDAVKEQRNKRITELHTDENVLQDKFPHALHVLKKLRRNGTTNWKEAMKVPRAAAPASSPAQPSHNPIQIPILPPTARVQREKYETWHQAQANQADCTIKGYLSRLNKAVNAPPKELFSEKTALLSELNGLNIELKQNEAEKSISLITAILQQVTGIYGKNDIPLAERELLQSGENVHATEAKLYLSEINRAAGRSTDAALTLNDGDERLTSLLEKIQQKYDLKRSIQLTIYSPGIKSLKAEGFPIKDPANLLAPSEDKLNLSLIETEPHSNKFQALTLAPAISNWSAKNTFGIKESARKLLNGSLRGISDVDLKNMIDAAPITHQNKAHLKELDRRLAKSRLEKLEEPKRSGPLNLTFLRRLPGPFEFENFYAKTIESLQGELLRYEGRDLSSLSNQEIARQTKIEKALRWKQSVENVKAGLEPEKISTAKKIRLKDWQKEWSKFSDLHKMAPENIVPDLPAPRTVLTQEKLMELERRFNAYFETTNQEADADRDPNKPPRTAIQKERGNQANALMQSAYLKFRLAIRNGDETMIEEARYEAAKAASVLRGAPAPAAPDRDSQINKAEQIRNNLNNVNDASEARFSEQMVAYHRGNLRHVGLTHQQINVLFDFEKTFAKRMADSGSTVSNMPRKEADHYLYVLELKKLAPRENHDDQNMVGRLKSHLLKLNDFPGMPRSTNPILA